MGWPTTANGASCRTTSPFELGLFETRFSLCPEIASLVRVNGNAYVVRRDLVTIHLSRFDFRIKDQNQPQICISSYMSLRLATTGKRRMRARSMIEQNLMEYTKPSLGVHMDRMRACSQETKSKRYSDNVPAHRRENGGNDHDGRTRGGIL